MRAQRYIYCNTDVKDKSEKAKNITLVDRSRSVVSLKDSCKNHLN